MPEIHAGKARPKVDTLWIVSGPSSVGKSTFIESDRCAEITGLPPGAAVVFAFQNNGADRDLRNTLFHYNLLRPAAAFLRHERRKSRDSVEKVALQPGHCDLTALQAAALMFSQDDAWRAIRTHPVSKRAIVLHADRDQIVARVRERVEVERSIRGGASNVYNSADWLWLYENLDLAAVYRAWRAELDAAGIEQIHLDSNDRQFRLCSPG